MGCPFRSHVIESIFPCLSGVVVNFPTMSLLGGCPIWNFETLKESSWSTIKGNVTDSFKECIRMEVLSIYVMINVWLFVEFIVIEVFNSYSYIILKLKFE